MNNELCRGIIPYFMGYFGIYLFILLIFIILKIKKK